MIRDKINEMRLKIQYKRTIDAKESMTLRATSSKR